jgi:hypothetical protein
MFDGWPLVSNRNVELSGPGPCDARGMGRTARIALPLAGCGAAAPNAPGGFLLLVPAYVPNAPDLNQPTRFFLAVAECSAGASPLLSRPQLAAVRRI